MVKTYYKITDCPFMARDRVKDNVSNKLSTVTAVLDETVWCLSDDGIRFYRNWTHEFDEVMKKGGGGLTRVERPQ